MKVVCDTNIYISAAEFGGTTQYLLDELVKNKVLIVTSQSILKETSQVLVRKFKWSQLETRDFISSLLKVAVLIEPKTKIKIIKKDPSDNKILECAIEGGADFVITGDRKHLLPLKKFKGIPIMSPQEFLKKVLYN